MSTATTTITAEPTAKDTHAATAAFYAAVVAYRTAFWSPECRAMKAMAAYTHCNDIVGLRFFRATAGGRRAAMILVDRYWPELAHLSERTRFVDAVQQSALGCLR